MAGESALLRFEPGLMIWTIIIFFTLLLVLRKIAWKPILEALDEREKKIDDALQQAQKAQRDTEGVVAENQRRVDEAIQRSEQIVQQAREDAVLARQRILDEAKTESRRVVDQGMERLEAEQRAALAEIRDMAADLAIRAAGRLIESSLTETQQREVVEKFLREVPDKSVN